MHAPRVAANFATLRSLARHINHLDRFSYTFAHGLRTRSHCLQQQVVSRSLPQPRNAISSSSRLHHKMVKKEDLADKELHVFANTQEFEDFLDREHQTLPEVYVKLAKKATGIPSITAAEGVEVALCFGWIDGQGCGIDERWWTTRFVPRRPKSMWSKKNVDTVGRLIEQGRMRQAGLDAVEAAKSDGRWARAYAGPATITEPDDFKAALATNTVAQETYASLNKTERYSVLLKIETASPAVRAKRIEISIKSLAEGKKPPRPGAKSTSTNEDKSEFTQAAKPSKVVKSTARKARAIVPPKTKSQSTKVEDFSRSTSQPRRSGLRARP